MKSNVFEISEARTRKLSKEPLTKAKKRRACNLCGTQISSSNVHILYCSECRKSSDLIRFSEWMPGISPESIGGDLDVETVA